MRRVGFENNVSWCVYHSCVRHAYEQILICAYLDSLKRKRRILIYSDIVFG
jgi:hypothetical protein